jgi:hypothetical protein
VGYFCSVHIRLVVDGAGRNQYHAWFFIPTLV